MTVSDTLIARVAARDYRDAAIRLEREALLAQAKGQPLTARIVKYWASIARNAARAEEWSDQR